MREKKFEKEMNIEISSPDESYKNGIHVKGNSCHVKSQIHRIMKSSGYDKP